MTDPNDTYKAGFRELAELLGRTPTTRDSGWLQLQEEYKRAWLPAEETVIAPKARPIIVNDPVCGQDVVVQIDSAAGPVNNGVSRQPAPQASAIGEEAGAREGQEATGGPGANQNGERAKSVPGWGSGALRIAEGPMRGAGGGVLAVCEACGQEWERERRRGRPARLCGECR